MKKIFAILALAVSTTAMADSINFETRSVQGVGTTDSTAYRMLYTHDVNKQVRADFSISQTQSNTASKAIGSRIETGLSYRYPLIGNLTGGIRVGIGEKFSTKGNATYYAVEPSVAMPVGPVNVRVGYRYRSAIDPDDGDQTRTARLNVSYPLTKKDSIAVGYDHVRGDSNQNVIRLGYTRSF
jgi:predicted porin